MMSAAEIRPDERLMLCASLVRQGSKLADIGTDHAYLTVWLCRNGVCPSAIAADINPEPLSRGKKTICEACLDGVIETRLSDGLSKIGADEADDIVIAGMGGELISKIIGGWRYSKDKNKLFILQPMTKSELLIEWLYKNGFEIINQDCCVASGKCYTVMSAAYTGAFPKTDRLFYYTGKLSPEANKTHRRFIQSHINRLRKQALGDERFGEIADGLEKLTEKLR